MSPASTESAFRTAFWVAAIVFPLAAGVSDAADPDINVLEAEVRSSGRTTGATETVVVLPPPSLNTNLLRVLTDDPKSLSAVSSLLFDGDEKERMRARRELRLVWLAPPPQPPTVDSPSYNAIDQFIASKWKEAGLPSAERAPELCDDTAFLRRVYLDLIGVIPTIEEARRFLESTDEEKRVKLVNELLARDADYAAHWTAFWGELIPVSSEVATEESEQELRRREWLFLALKENRAWDVMVAQLIDPSMPGHLGVAVTREDSAPGASRIVPTGHRRPAVSRAADVAYAFLGVNARCAICHDDPENEEWPHERLLAFAGFFAEDDLAAMRAGQSEGGAIQAAFPFDVPGAPNTPPASLEARLHRVAQLIVDPANLRFSKALVNRLWKRFFGLGLVEPCDDFQTARPSSHPELLAWLADDFARHAFDMKHAVRRIVASRTYQLRYDPEKDDRNHADGSAAPRYFQSPSLRRLTAEQTIDSVRIAVSQEYEPDQRAYLEQNSTSLGRALGLAPWRDPLGPYGIGRVGEVQALEILHGPAYWGMISDSSMIRSLAEKPDSSLATERLYWAALSRPPTAAEHQAGIEFLEATFSGEFKKAGSKTVIWIDDAPPSGSTVSGSAGPESWVWGTRPGNPVLSGIRSHTQGGAGVQRQHHFTDAEPPLEVEPDDVLFVHVYLDPAHLPKEIMIQWNDGTWEHRAYWGENLIRLGSDGTASRMSRGPLPKAGEWVMLGVPAREIGIPSGSKIIGWSFDQLDGTVHWDSAGVIRVRNVPPEEPLRDAFWALLASPEFQFVR